MILLDLKMSNSSQCHYLLKDLEQQEMAEKLMNLFGPSDFDDFLNFFVGFFWRFSGKFFLEAIFMDREKRPEAHTCREICEVRANELT